MHSLIVGVICELNHLGSFSILNSGCTYPSILKLLKLLFRVSSIDCPFYPLKFEVNYEISTLETELLLWSELKLSSDLVVEILKFS
jgi:hypothetical protein